MAGPATTTIKVRDDGPYKVTGPVRIVDVDGVAYDLPEGEAAVLCRCGHSATKPFCDGAHRAAGFTSRERAAPGPAHRATSAAPPRSDG